MRSKRLDGIGLEWAKGTNKNEGQREAGPRWKEWLQRGRRKKGKEGEGREGERTTSGLTAEMPPWKARGPKEDGEDEREGKEKAGERKREKPAEKFRKYLKDL